MRITRDILRETVVIILMVIAVVALLGMFVGILVVLHVQVF